MGGHTASGYWVDNNRATTIEGLYAAGDVAGGCPQKYVTGALAEGEIAAEAILEYLAKASENDKAVSELSDTAAEKKAEYESHLNATRSLMNAEQLEEAMQKIMDQYAGGIGTDYRYSETSLAKADEKIAALLPVVDTLAAADTYELMQIYELRERLIVCRAVIAHLAARKETRWHSFGENTDYPEQSEEWMKYVNSRMENGEIRILYRDLITKESADSNTAAKGAGER